MKIDRLRNDSVRSTRKIDNFILLSDEDLRRVVGGGNAVMGDVDPEICAIHDYYMSDSMD